MKQLALDKALMVKWAKGFDCSDVIGEDVGQLLNDAINRRGVGLSRLDFVFNEINSLSDRLGHQRCCACYS